MMCACTRTFGEFCHLCSRDALRTAGLLINVRAIYELGFSLANGIFVGLEERDTESTSTNIVWRYACARCVCCSIFWQHSHKQPAINHLYNRRLKVTIILAFATVITRSRMYALCLPFQCTLAVVRVRVCMWRL